MKCPTHNVETQEIGGPGSRALYRCPKCPELLEVNEGDTGNKKAAADRLNAAKWGGFLNKGKKRK